MSNEICIAELNSSRICHAWAALVGAIDNDMKLIKEGILCRMKLWRYP